MRRHFMVFFLLPPELAEEVTYRRGCRFLVVFSRGFGYAILISSLVVCTTAFRLIPLQKGEYTVSMYDGFDTKYNQLPGGKELLRQKQGQQLENTTPVRFFQ